MLVSTKTPHSIRARCSVVQLCGPVSRLGFVFFPCPFFLFRPETLSRRLTIDLLDRELVEQLREQRISRSELGAQERK